MPYKSEKMRLSEKQDRRRKLTAEQKVEIKNLYETGAGSLQALADLYGVSKKTVLLIVNPISKQKNDERLKSVWRQYQQKGEEWNKVVREHRRYKQTLFLKGELKEKGEM
jgi:DNA invertase Pin-like site-specific DNA recombinase